MDDNYVMSTSVLQYLEDIRSFMKESHVYHTKDKLELLSTHKLDDNESYKAVEFESEEQAGSNLCGAFAIEPQDQLSLFEHKLSLHEEEIDHDMRADLSSPQDIEESKESDEKKNTNSKSESSSKDNSPEEQDMKKPKNTNKERARKARQRKKKYYEDLEKRAEYLEKKVTELNKELDYCKQKIRVYEGKNASSEPKGESCLQRCLIDECIQMLKSVPEETRFLSIIEKLCGSYGPFGKEKIKILDNTFNSIVENMLSGGTKLMLYVIDKENMPKTAEEFINYSKLKKFEKYEKYPDPLVRKFIDSRTILNLTETQIHHFYKNQLPKLHEIKDEMRKGISMLFGARDQIYKS